MKDRGKYINPFTDFGFKKLFGSEPNKDLLIDFLNQLLPKHHKVLELQYGKNEHQGKSEIDRKVAIDVFCTGVDGTKFIIEVQRAWQQFFKDRTIFYASSLIQDQGKKGSTWSYELSPIYCISILDYRLEKPAIQTKMKYTVQLMDVENNKIFYDKLTFIYLEVPKFVKKEKELETDFEKWMFVLKNITRLDKLPDILKTNIMTKFFEAAEISKMPTQEREAYEESLKIYRDNENVQKGAEQIGFQKAEEKYLKILEDERKQKEVAILNQEGQRNQKEAAIILLHTHGVSILEIANKLGISEEEVAMVIKKKI